MATKKAAAAEPESKDAPQPSNDRDTIAAIVDRMKARGDLSDDEVLALRHLKLAVTLLPAAA